MPHVSSRTLSSRIPAKEGRLMPAWVFFFLGLVCGQVVLLAVLALCSMAADDPRRGRRPW